MTSPSKSLAARLLVVGGAIALVLIAVRLLPRVITLSAPPTSLIGFAWTNLVAVLQACTTSMAGVSIALGIFIGVSTRFPSIRHRAGLIAAGLLIVLWVCLTNWWNLTISAHFPMRWPWWVTTVSGVLGLVALSSAFALIGILIISFATRRFRAPVLAQPTVSTTITRIVDASIHTTIRDDSQGEH